MGAARRRGDLGRHPQRRRRLPRHRRAREGGLPSGGLRPGRGGLGRRRHRDGVPRLQGRHRYGFAAGGRLHRRCARAGQPRPARTVSRQRRAGRARGRRGRRARHRRRTAALAAARSSASSRPTRRCCRCSAGGSPSGRPSASRGRAASARTAAATSSSPSRPATAACARIDDDAPAVADVRTLANHAMNPLFDAVIEATEEAILNAILASPTMTARRSHRPRAADRPAAGRTGEVRATCYSPGEHPARVVDVQRGDVGVVEAGLLSRSANVVTTYA